MDKQKSLKKARRRYREILVSIGAVDKIARKISPHLPKGWGIECSGYGCLEITKWEEANAIEFRVICDLVEKITGKKLSRKALGEHSLRGEKSFFETPHRWVSIDIYMGRVDGCKIEKKRKMMTLYEASPECLGLRGEA